MPSPRLLLELGRGGMGTVYLAVTEGPGGFTKLKVVKQLRDDMAENPQLLQMFLEEARLSARLNHANIVQTNEVGFDGRHHFIEMEYLEGQSLDALVRRVAKGGGALELVDGVWVMTQVLAALHYAHTLADVAGRPLRIVHRDVSPHNVFVTFDGTVKLLDFGIAKAIDSQLDTATGIVKGKVTYMAPEQALRRPLDGRSDVFSVGVMLWQLVTGERLWKDLSDFEIYMRLEAGDIPSANSVKADIGPAMDAICRKALAKEPEDRYGSAAEMRAALEAWLDTLPERPGPTRLAKITTAAFADRREAIRSEVEAQLRHAEHVPRDSLRKVPLLTETQAYQATATDSAFTEASPVEQQRPERRGRSGMPPSRVPGDGSAGSASRMALVAGGATLAAAALGGVLWVAARSPGRTEPSAAAAIVAAASAVAPPTHACTKNADCVSTGTNTICRKSACVPLETSECRALAERGQLEDDNTVWIGAMFPQKGPGADSGGLAAMQTVDLVRRDFAQFAGGLPALDGKGAMRPLAILACDDSSEGRRAAEHLANDVAVPAVIGFRSSQEAIDLATSVFLPKRILVIVANNVAASVTAVPEPPDAPRLVWRTIYSTRAEAGPLVHIVSDILEPNLHALHVDTVRIAMVRPTSTMAVSLSDAVGSVLRFNGKTVAENEASYREFIYGESNREITPEDYARTIRQVVDFEPHVVLFVGGEKDADAIILPVEKSWPARSRTRPRYVYEGTIDGDAVMDHPAPEFRKRLYGISSFSQRPPNAKYTAHFNEVFATHLSPRGSFAAVYDAGYLVAYAAYASALPMTGESVGRDVLRLLPPGDPIDVGPTRIFDAYAALRAGHNLDLNGAGSSLDFDPATGETPVDFSIVCLGPDFDNQESGLVFDRSADVLRGSWRCK